MGRVSFHRLAAVSTNCIPDHKRMTNSWSTPEAIDLMSNHASSVRVVLILALLLILALPEAVNAQAPQPDGGGARTGLLPNSWLLGGPKCVEIPQFQIHEYNEDSYILRESGCTNYEKPFLYLLFGKDKALLLDTGAGKTEISRYVRAVTENWLRRNKRESIPL